MVTRLPSLPQTIHLLALSRGERVDLPPMTRRELLRAGWIVPATHELTEDGRAALAGSEHLGEAQRRLDAGRQGRPWKVPRR